MISFSFMLCVRCVYLTSSPLAHMKLKVCVAGSVRPFEYVRLLSPDALNEIRTYIESVEPQP
jgi:hypothetical protein